MQFNKNYISLRILYYGEHANIVTSIWSTINHACCFLIIKNLYFTKENNYQALVQHIFGQFRNAVFQQMPKSISATYICTQALAHIFPLYMTSFRVIRRNLGGSTDYFSCLQRSSCVNLLLRQFQHIMNNNFDVRLGKITVDFR